MAACGQLVHALLDSGQETLQRSVLSPVGTMGDMVMSPWLRMSNMTKKIQIQESNYNGHRYIDNFRGWFDPTNPIWGTVTYIYPD